MGFVTFDYQRFLAYTQGYKERQVFCFSDIKAGDSLFEIIEKTQDFQILERKVEYVRHIGKKTHFTLEPVPGMKDHRYCPYSNKYYTVSKQFHPIFVNREKAISFLSHKFIVDRDYLTNKLGMLARKQAFLKIYAERDTDTLFTTSTRRARRSRSVLDTITTISPF